VEDVDVNEDDANISVDKNELFSDDDTYVNAV